MYLFEIQRIISLFHPLNRSCLLFGDHGTFNESWNCVQEPITASEITDAIALGQYHMQMRSCVGSRCEDRVQRKVKVGTSIKVAFHLENYGRLS